ncbi:uncharacterized protein [Anabrus simplex]|uniref:uncharacterized protein n=1 Tax=Anabrus simplex TaxID=316456 RepID=UPI0035A31420
MACASSSSSALIAVVQLAVWCITGSALLYRGVVISMTPPRANSGSPQVSLNVSEVTPSFSDSAHELKKNSESSANNLPTMRSKQEGFPNYTANGLEDGHSDSGLDREINISSTVSSSILLTPFISVSVRKVNETGEPIKRQTTSFRVRPGALLMVVTGAAMLVVGPTLLIFRICDSGRPHRTFSKLQMDEPVGDLTGDQPPSYEEATGGVPRYSAVFQEVDSEEERTRSTRVERETPC